MPKNLGTILNHIATVAGVQDSDDLKAILTNPELSKIQIPDDLATSLESNLHSEASAIAKAGARIKAEALNGANVHIKRLAEQDFKDDATFLAELEAEKNPGKQAEMLAKKVREVEAAKAKAPDADKAELTRQINELKAAKATIEQAKEAALNEAKAQHETELTSMLIRQHLSGIKMPKKYDDLDPEMRLNLLEQALQRDFTDKKVKVVRKNGRLELVQEDGTDYFDKSVKVDFKGFVEGSASRNKLLATSEPDPNPNPTPGQPRVIEPGKQNASDARFANTLQDQLKEYAAAGV